MKKFRPILLLLLVFIAGIAVGVVGTRTVLRQIYTSAMKNPAAIRERVENDLAAKLELSPEQRARVHDILVESHDEMRALRTEFHPKFQAIMERSDRQIAATLGTEQQARFEEYKKERRFWRPFPPMRPPEQNKKSGGGQPPL